MDKYLVLSSLASKPQSHGQFTLKLQLLQKLPEALFPGDP